MQVAIVSDIHGNRHAFQAVLDDIATTVAAETWCLGDLVGYGAEPDACVELAQRHVTICLSGNHDLAVTGELSLDEFSRGAEIAARWTREVMDEANVDWLRTLRTHDEDRSVGLYHASPRDPVWEYVLSALLAELCLDARATGSASSAIRTSRSRSSASRASWPRASRAAAATSSTSPRASGC